MATMPELTLTAQEMYDACDAIFQSELYADSENDYAGAFLCAAIATMIDPVSDIVRDQTDGTPGYGILFDPQGLVDIGRPEWLPWTAQFIGDSQAVLAASSVAEQVEIILTPQNFTVGRPATVIAAVKATLTGTQTVIYNSFLGGVWCQTGITTYASETPDPAATEAAALAVLPAWIVPTFSVVTGGTYATLAASHSEYSQMEAAHTSYADILAHPGA